MIAFFIADLRIAYIFLAFQELLKNLLTIREQNCKILSILEKSVVPEFQALPKDLPVPLPIDSLENLTKLEDYLLDDVNFKNFVSILNIIISYTEKT